MVGATPFRSSSSPFCWWCSLPGGSYLKMVPPARADLGRLGQLSFWRHKITDYFWHLALPVTAMVIGGFATLTMLTKNSFLDEIGKQYVVTARAKGVDRGRHPLPPRLPQRHAPGHRRFPSAFISMFFTGSLLLIEVIFSLDGLGLLGFEATISRDYPVMFGTLYIFTLIGLVTKLLSDLTYTLVDPAHRLRRPGGAMKAPSPAAAAAALPGQPAGLLVPVDFPGPLLLQPGGRVRGQRQALLVYFDGGFYAPVFKVYPEDRLRRRFRPRPPTTAIPSSRT